MKAQNWLYVSCLIGAFAVYGCGDDATSGGYYGSICGNGVVEDGEACDDGNSVNGDGCSADCKAIEPGYVCYEGKPCEQVSGVCGNGKVDDGEACDDGNQVSGDGCSADCKKVNRVANAQRKGERARAVASRFVAMAKSKATKCATTATPTMATVAMPIAWASRVVGNARPKVANATPKMAIAETGSSIASAKNATAAQMESSDAPTIARSKRATTVRRIRRVDRIAGKWVAATAKSSRRTAKNATTEWAITSKSVAMASTMMATRNAIIRAISSPIVAMARRTATKNAIMVAITSTMPTKRIKATVAQSNVKRLVGAAMANGMATKNAIQKIPSRIMDAPMNARPKKAMSAAR